MGMVENYKLMVNYTPHAGQLEVLNDLRTHGAQADIISLVKSRGWGGTIFTTGSILLPTLLYSGNIQALWIAPIYKTCQAAVDDVWFGVDENTGLRFIPQLADDGFKFWDFTRSEMRLEMFNGSICDYRSADNPDSVVGKGYNLIILDEAALLDELFFHLQVLPMARRKGCKLVLVSSPRGRNWFHRMYLNGQDPAQPIYRSYRQPWWKRPDYPEVLKRLMHEVPDHIRRQEFEAEFIGDGAGVFQNMEAVFKGPQIQFPGQNQEWRAQLDRSAIEAETWVIGVDLAKQTDYTVITILGMHTARLAYYRRFNKTDYRTVLDLIRRLAREFDADVVFDATGVGAGVADFMSRDLNAFPFTLTNDSKCEIINRLALSFEYSELSFPNIQTMRNEFELFTFTTSRTGKILYSAPGGKHDDIVISVALANWYRLEHSGKSQVDTVDEYMSAMNDAMNPRSRLEELMSEDD